MPSVTSNVAPGLRIGRGLEPVLPLQRRRNLALRPVFGSGEDWNKPSVTVPKGVACCARSLDRARIEMLWTLGVTVPVLVCRSGNAVPVFSVKVVSVQLLP